MSHVSDAVSERLSNYYGFQPTIIERVSEVAERQDGLTYAEFLKEFQVPEVVTHTPDDQKAVDVLDLRPADDDGRDAVVLYLPMGSGLTPNKIVRATTLYAANPQDRLIVVGNAGIPFRDSRGKVALKDMRKVAQGNLAPIVESALDYIEKQNIEGVDYLGYSLGADKALESAAQAARFDHEAFSVVAAEPASAVKRNLLTLTGAFMATDAGYRDYLKVCDTPLLKESRELSETMISYTAGLARLSNVAIANGLAHDGFKARVEAALETDTTLFVHVMWGSESELAIDGVMCSTLADLRQREGAWRVRQTRFSGQKHGMADDISLHAAMMLHGLNR